MRRLRPRGLLYVALGCAILATQTLKADTILINDLPGLFTVSVTDPVREQASGGIGFADVTIFNPPGATLICCTGQDLLAEWLVLEPPTLCRGPFDCASDFITLDGSELPSGDTILDFFFSVRVAPFFADCSEEPCIVENGDVQPFAGFLEWSDGTIDTIEFKSTEAVPEPSTLLLLCTGVLGVTVSRWRPSLTWRGSQKPSSATG
jgi:hypothetical protein